MCLGAICSVGLVKAFMKSFYSSLGGGANSVDTAGYNKDAALGAKIIGTFVLPFRFAVFMVHFATVPITDTAIYPTSSFGAAVICDSEKVLGWPVGLPSWAICGSTSRSSTPLVSWAILAPATTTPSFEDIAQAENLVLMGLKT